MLSENRYRNRTIVREYLNEVGRNNLKFNGYTFLLKAGIHIADRMSDRKFPIDEFKYIIEKIADLKEKLIDIAEDDLSSRVNFYGHDAYMIGVSFHKSYNFENKYDITLRTMYKDSRIESRQRSTSVKEVFL